MRFICSCLFLSAFVVTDLGASPALPTKQEVLQTYTKGPFIAYRGSQGYRGKRGKRGERGPRGEKGPDGALGPRGPAGFRGLQGPACYDVGPIGNTGLLGDAGLTGPSGPQGLSGPTGAKGPIGPIHNFSFDPTSPFIFDEFFSGNATSNTVGSLGWSIPTGSISTTLPSSPLSNHPGVIGLVSSGVTGATGPFDSLLQLSPSSGSVYLPDPFDVRMVIRVKTLNVPSLFGFFSEDLLSSLSFVANNTPGSWSIAWSTNGTPQTQSLQTPVTSDWVFLRIYRSTANGDIRFYINNAFVFNLPAAEAPSGACNVTVGSQSTQQNTNRNIDIDYISIYWPQLNR